MATHKYITCDRCGKYFNYRNEMWAAILKVKKPKKIHITKLFYGIRNEYDYMEDDDYDLCGECAEKLKEFMKRSVKHDTTRD